MGDSIRDQNAAAAEFEPTLPAAHARLARVDPDAYARTRNALHGAVSRLSPYITHGLLSLPEVYSCVHARHPLDAKHKFVFELGWRAYWRHVWEHLGDGIHQSLHEGLLPESAYEAEIPLDVLHACTGIAAIDLAVRELYATGYLHNHARMWLASYLVHLRKVHWHTGAQWMLGHLLDGDIASNSLSWQWVAGTGSSKPYLFNADNVAKYAPSSWHSPGTVIDTSYEALDRMARSEKPVVVRRYDPHTATQVQPPDLRDAPTGGTWVLPPGNLTAGCDVWLQHPWSLGAVPEWAGRERVVVAVAFSESHAQNPWSARRWRFVSAGLQAQTPHLWFGSTAQIAQALRGASSVHWQHDPHIDSAFESLKNLLKTGPAAPVMAPQPKPCLFEPVENYCQSFTQWWRKTSLIEPAPIDLVHLDSCNASAAKA